MFTTRSWKFLGITATLVLGAAVADADQPRTKSKPKAGRVGTASYRTQEAPRPAPPETRGTAPVPVELGTAKPYPGAFASAEPCAASCPPRSRGFCRKLWDWLTYRPVTHTTVCGKEPCCTPPLFAYFLEYCPPPATPPGKHFGGSACPDGRCVVKHAKHPASEKERSSWLSGGIFGMFKDDPEKEEVEGRRTRDEDIQPVVRKVLTNAKTADPNCLRDGKDCAKWRGLPARR